MAEHSTAAADQAKVFALIKDIRCALMVTRGPDGTMSARPMVAIQKDGAPDLWFMSRADTPKTREVLNDRHVLLAYSEPKDQNYVSVSGSAELVHDRTTINAMWSEPLRVWFPKGPDDPAICLIRVVIESAEYWDAPSSAWVYAKARMTGEPPHPGDNKIVNF